MTIPLILVAIGQLIVEFREFSLRSLYIGEMLFCLLFGLKMQDPDVGKIRRNLLVLFFFLSYTTVSNTALTSIYAAIFEPHIT